MKYSRTMVALLGMSLAACNPGVVTRNVTIGNIHALATDADLRVVTAQPSPLGLQTKDRQVICSEPSPDIAKALSTALSLAATAKTPSGVDASGNVSRTTAEQVTVLAGRTAAVVALRDGLYKACEAYANGIIGDNAYSLILSRYGDLLVTLMLSESIATTPAGASGTAVPEGIRDIYKQWSSEASQYLQAGLFVSCLTDFDPTRPGSQNGTKHNELLTKEICTDLLKHIASLPPAK